MDDPVDRLLQCSVCGKTFLFTVKEQKFFQERQFTDPRRCRDCRDQRRGFREDEASGIFRSPDTPVPTPLPKTRSDLPKTRSDLPKTRSELPRPRSEPPQSRGESFRESAELRNRGADPLHELGQPRTRTPTGLKTEPAAGRELHRSKTPRVITNDQLKEWRRDKPLFEATCSRCSRSTLVPFRPIQGRPVYCRECFRLVHDREPTPLPQHLLDSQEQHAEEEPVRRRVLLPEEEPMRRHPLRDEEPVAQSSLPEEEPVRWDPAPDQEL